MSQQLSTTTAVIGIDIGKNSFHVVGLDGRGAIALRQRWSPGQMETRLANIPHCLIGMEACVGAHHLSRRLKGLGHDARLMPAKYVRPYSKGQKNDFRDAEAIAEAVQRPTMKFVATKTPALMHALARRPGGSASACRSFRQSELLTWCRRGFVQYGSGGRVLWRCFVVAIRQHVTSAITGCRGRGLRLVS